MFDRKLLAPLLTVLLVASVALPGAAAVADTTNQTEAETYAGSHVEFETAGDAIVNYNVDGTTVAESVRVQSQSETRARGGISIGADVSAVTGFAGADVSVQAQSETSAQMTTESGAEISAHDNGHGSLVVAAGGESQYVGMNVSQSATVESEGENRVVVTTADESRASVLVVGEGNVAVNDDGNVTAELEGDSHLVVRSYDGDRSEDDQKQEDLITSERAAAQVYLTGNGTDVVDYGQETTVDVTQQAEGSVQMTVERSQSQGKVVLTTVSDAAFQSVEDVEVHVDGEAAVEASSYAELESAADGGESSKYMVREEGSAEGSADVLVALNHFSERSVTMEESQSADGGSDGSDGDSTNDDATATPGGSGPGFTLVAAVLALVAIVAIARRRLD